MKACFRFFKAPFFFVGWLAPANGLTHCFYTLLTQPGPFKLRFQNRKVTGSLHSLRLSLEDRLRLGIKNKIEILFCSSLGLHSLRLSLEDRLHLGIKNIIEILFCSSLGLHYLCPHNVSIRM
jgi:hypothetical protein